jgi:adenylate cyclase
MRKKILRYILYVVSILILLGLNQLSIFQFFQGKIFDARFKYRGALETPTDIVIVAIDNESLDWVGKWPWPRSKYAQMVRILSEAGVKLVVFDVFFDLPTSFDPEDDVAFAEAIKEAGNVILAAGFQNIQRQNKDNKLIKYKGLPFNPPIKILRENALDIGIVHPYLDADLTIRSFPLLSTKRGKAYPYLSLQTARYKLGGEVAINYEPGAIYLGKTKIPLNRLNLLTINYRGPAQSFETIPFGRILDGTFLKYNPNFLKNKVVLIGATALELHDYFATPFSKDMAGVEVHANAVQTILDNNFIYVVPFWFDFIIMLVSLIVSIRLFLKFNARQTLLLFLFWITGIMALDYLSFILLRISMDSFSYLTAVLFPFLIVGGYKYYREEKEKGFIKNVFSQYVDKSVVDQLLSDPSKINLGGDKKVLSVFFSDIRAFTTFSEKHTPEEIVSTLNEYLDAMTEVIFESKGTLDKYVGDEIMAIFGAPIELESHAKSAVGSALRQLEVLDKLNEKFRKEGRTEIKVGMGIHSGEVVIGNIGSKHLKDYTVIGDAVNLAARLEAATRNYGTSEEPVNLIISDSTYQLVKADFQCDYLDEIIVKGKTVPVKIYWVKAKT